VKAVAENQVMKTKLSKLIASEKGFTLVEMMIAITILAFLSTYTAQTIRSAIANKDKTDQSFDGQAKTRDVLKIMERDINLAFHYVDFHTQLYNIAKQERIQRKKDELKKGKPKSSKSATSGTTPPNTTNNKNRLTEEEKNFKPRKEKSYTHFVGSEEEIHLATLSLSQTRTNKSQSDQGEVGYYLKECSNRLNKDKRSKCLVRRVSNIIDDDPEKGGNETILLEDISEFKLSYLGPETGDEWIKSWDSQAKGISNGAQQGKFPFAVQIQIAILVKATDKSKKDRTFRAATVAKLHFPNNIAKKKYKAPIPNDTKGITNGDTSATTGTGGSAP
jgi:prepilin-type N-terminal cleavage/methylation domain-containing protein